MQTHQQVRKFLGQFNVKSFVVKVPTAALLGLLFAAMMLGVTSTRVLANQFGTCRGGDQIYRVVGGDTLSRIAFRYNTTYQALARHNQIINPNLIYIRQIICIPHPGTVTVDGGQQSVIIAPVIHPVAPPAPGSGPVGHSNVFPYGSCTWWANQRYYQLHGSFVPWRTHANAWEWRARAADFGWHVSNLPYVGAILDLQSDVQGASYLGHVAVVERVLSNGHFIASSMSWAPFYWMVSYYEFVPGPGVTFISQ